MTIPKIIGLAMIFPLDRNDLTPTPLPGVRGAYLRKYNNLAMIFPLALFFPLTLWERGNEGVRPLI